MIHNDLTFFTNEPERDLYSRFSKILKSNTQFFDILVGYFRTSGFFKMYEAMENVEKIRILVGLNVDKYTVKIIDKANNEIAFDIKYLKNIGLKANECTFKGTNYKSPIYVYVYEYDKLVAIIMPVNLG